MDKKNVVDTEKNIAIYDFCQTIVDFETADAFVHYVMQHTKDKRMYVKELIRKFLKKLRVFSVLERLIKEESRKCSINKAFILKELKGYTKVEIEYYAEMYYEEVVREHFIVPIIEEIKEQKNRGYKIVVVSASYEPFLKHFQREYKVDLLITNHFKYTDEDVFTGEITRADCIGANKVKYLRECIPEFDKENYGECNSYGDSFSDRYILAIAKKGFVVSYKNKKKWVEDTDFEEIVYE